MKKHPKKKPYLQYKQQNISPQSSSSLPLERQKTSNFFYLWGLAIIIGLIYLIFPVNTPQIKQVPTAKQEAASKTTALNQELSYAVPARMPQRQTEFVPPQPTETQTAPPSPTSSPTPTFITHKVSAGDMPLSIALAYDIEVEELLAINQITDPSRLQIGQQLIIPVTVTPTPQPPTPTPTPKYSPTPPPTPVIYIVEPGDSPLSIALRHNTTANAIMLVNGLFNPSGLQIGQELVIPDDEIELSEIAAKTKTSRYVVRQGDTLLALTYRYGSTVEDIMELNPTVDPTNLQIGDELIIPHTRTPGSEATYSINAYPTTAPVIIPDPPAPGIIGLQQQMIMAVNAHRQAHGLTPYQADPILNQVALARAQDMDSRGYFGHWTPEGKRARDLVAEQGLHPKWVGENIERNVQPESKTVAHSINWFMNDPPHRYNILHPRYDRIGVGVSDNQRFHTFVLVFAGD